jgi:thioredoxin 1
MNPAILSDRAASEKREHLRGENMSTWSVVGIVVGGIVALFVGLRLLLVYKIMKQKGKPSPDLPGKMGKVVRKGRPALFYFYSPQCGACKTMTPVVRQMEKSGKDVFAIDISRDMSTARLFGIMATPTTIQVQKGIIHDVKIGPQPKAALESLL